MLQPERIQEAFFGRYPDRILTIDSHTEGEPTRLVVAGVGDLPGATIREKRDRFEARHDAVRLLLTREPRGHRGIMAAVVTGPVSPRARFGLFFMDARRYPYLCGHATIGAVASLIDAGLLEAPDGETAVTVDTPSGPLEAHTLVAGGRARSVAIDMVPSFVYDAGRRIQVPGFGEVAVDLVCVGGFFAMVSARSVGIDLVPENADRLVSLGMAVIDAANRQVSVHHPERPEVTTVDVTEFYGEDPETGAGRSVVVYGESHMDRSPCGTGTTARMTLLHHQGRLAAGEAHANAGPLGTVFEGRILRTCAVGPFPGIVARVRGSARITGLNAFVLDDADPFPRGFLL